MEKTQREDYKITYLLGAGASYQSVPIWKKQGETMMNVAADVLNILNAPQTEKNLLKDKDLITFFEDLKEFGHKAIEYGSIDIYAKRLFLLQDANLNRLKHCLSVYFDLWENFHFKKYTLPSTEDKKITYEKIDKRYYSLLSVLLEKDENAPKLNSNVNFITWNYDLQIENCYESFLSNKLPSYEDINSFFKFMNQDDNERSDVIHLNGFRGVFYDEHKNLYENLDKKNKETIESYLGALKSNFGQFKKMNYNSIKYAWEATSKSIEKAKKVLSETNILIIIGYSFPPFNRKIDSELIESFNTSRKFKKVVYQDPQANEDIVKVLFSGIKNVEILNKELNQFHIPQELLFPPAKRRVTATLL